jgi:murein DD-endopeptidase MepM/ murein hydrolase activator NlpD
VAAARSLRPTEGSIVSSKHARHRKPSRTSSAGPSAATRHRRRSPIVSALQNKPARIAAAAVAGSALMVSAWPAATHLLAQAPRPAGVGQADALGRSAANAYGRAGRQQPAASLGAQAGYSGGVQASQQPEIVSVGIAVASHLGRHRKPGQAGQRAADLSGYLNPLRAVSDLTPERIDMGVDFTGSGPVYALGDAVITNATGESPGWPGGGWITYQLTGGPGAGLTVYVAEDVTPTVQVGQHVSSSTVIGTMFGGYDGIETGWAQPGGLSAESQLPVAGGIGGYGPFPTMIGLNFEELLQSLGVPAASNRTDPAYGLLPANYPTDFS